MRHLASQEDKTVALVQVPTKRANAIPEWVPAHFSSNSNICGYHYSPANKETNILVSAVNQFIKTLSLKSFTF